MNRYTYVCISNNYIAVTIDANTREYAYHLLCLTVSDPDDFILIS